MHSRLSRAEIRARGVLALELSEALALKQGTLPVTMHLNEVEMTRLEQEGQELLRDYPAEQRRRMARSGQALPDGSFPIKDCVDASDAIRSIGRASPSNRGRARSHIRKRVRALGCTGSIYDNWK